MRVHNGEQRVVHQGRRPRQMLKRIKESSLPTRVIGVRGSIICGRVIFITCSMLSVCQSLLCHQYFRLQ